MRTENREIWLMQANGEGLASSSKEEMVSSELRPGSDGRHLAYIKYRYNSGMP